MFVFLGALNALVRCGKETNRSKNHKPKDRRAAYTEFQYQGVVVCKDLFQFVNGIGERRLKNLKARFLSEGVSAPRHGNTLTKSKARKISLPEVKNAVTFIKNFAQNHGLVLPGRVPGYRHNVDLLLLPSAMSKKYVYQKYSNVYPGSSISIQRWYLSWNLFCKNIVIQRPRSDLCTICQQSFMKVNRLNNLPEEEKRACIEESLRHLTIVEHERCYYRDIIKKCREQITHEVLSKCLRSMPKPCTENIELHISFDYAQQILLPCDSQQIGELYFLAGYKVALFGIAVEPINKFYLYIIPEACSTGKGPNAIISMLHHFFENFSLGENNIICHADNCCGQNKNRFVLQYLTWRVANKLHKRVQMSFLPVGHTKFAPDLYFGLFKRRLTMCKAHCLKDVAKIAIEATSVKNSITPIIVGNESNGITYVPTYNWASFFACGKAVPHIRKYHHFTTSSSKPNFITVKEFETSQTKEVNIFPLPLPTSFPEILEPEGLSFERRKYLFQHIRKFVDKKSKDKLCPKPIPKRTAEENFQVEAVLKDEESTPLATSTPKKAIKSLTVDARNSSRSKRKLKMEDPTACLKKKKRKL